MDEPKTRTAGGILFTRAGMLMWAAEKSYGWVWRCARCLALTDDTEGHAEAHGPASAAFEPAPIDRVAHWRKEAGQ